jgi:hypothetical protein
MISGPTIDDSMSTRIVESVRLMIGCAPSLPRGKQTTSPAPCEANGSRRDDSDFDAIRDAPTFKELVGH